MKTLLFKFIFMLAMIVYSTVSLAQVFVDGVVYDYLDDNEPIQVTVMEDDKFYQSIETSKGGKFRLRLQPNHYYVINMSKPDHYISKIAVDTHVPFTPGPEYYTEIPIEADLVRKYIDMDPDVMKKPLSIFSYDAASETFIQDDEYLQEARAQLEAFLYEVEEAKKRDNEALAAENPEKSPENVDNLNQEIQITEVSENNNANESTSNAHVDSNQIAENNIKNLNEHEDELAINDSRNETSINNTNSGPSVPQVDSPSNNNQENSDQLDTTNVSDTALTKDTATESKSYNISIRINGQTYDPNSKDSIQAEEDLDIKITGIPENEYSSFRYQLDGKDQDFRNLNNDEVDYEDLDEGDYTFVLSSNNNNFEEIRVPINIQREGSDFPWIIVIIGIIVVALIAVAVNKRKRNDDIVVTENREADINRRDLNDNEGIDNRRDPDSTV